MAAQSITLVHNRVFFSGKYGQKKRADMSKTDALVIFLEARQ